LNVYLKRRTFTPASSSKAISAAFCIFPLLSAHFPIASGPDRSYPYSPELLSCLPSRACPREVLARTRSWSFGALGSTPTRTIYTPTFHITPTSLMYAAVPVPICISWCVLRVGGIVATLCTYLGRRAGGYSPHSMSRVLRRCIDPCAPPAAVPLDPG
jgi:hypothetical protein